MTEEAIRIDTCSECGEEEDLLETSSSPYVPYTNQMLYGTLLKLICLCILGLNWKRIFGELSVLVLNYYQTHMTYSKRSSLQVDPATRLARLRRRVRESSVR